MEEPKTPLVRQFPYNVVLRIAATAAGIQIIHLRGVMDPSRGWIFMTLLFYCGAYLLIALSPASWAGFQVGFAIGYSIAMQAATIVILLMQLPFASASPADLDHLRILRYANLVLLVVAVVTWIWNRRKIDNLLAFALLPIGIVYPFAAFFVQGGISLLIYRRP